RRSAAELWVDVFIFVLVPLVFVIVTANLIIGLALCVFIWPIYFYVRARKLKARHSLSPTPLEALNVIDAEQRVVLIDRARVSGFWFGTTFAVLSLLVDLIFYGTGAQFPLVLFVWVVVRTFLLPVAGYFLGQAGGVIALCYALTPKVTGNGYGGEENGAQRAAGGIRNRRQLLALSTDRAKEEVKDLVPNDLPLRSKGAQRFYLTLLAALVLFYPALDN